MWRDILLLNREHVLAALDGLEDQFGELRRALAGGDARALNAWLKAGWEWRRRVET
jgi:prephenate dehydrogenase